ncbi:MAG TPA: MucB/RseB C-terminal domain-containing protein [Mizugakiibacter sp.]
MTRRAGAWGALLFAGALAPLVARAVDASDWLARMHGALHELDYSGALVVQRADRMQVMQLFHAAGHPERERLLSLDGPPRELVRSGTTLVWRAAERPAVAWTADAPRSLMPLLPDAMPAWMADNYRAALYGEAHVAGYDAVMVELSPRDRYRYGYRLWLERRSALPLRTQLLGPQGEPLGQCTFARLQIGRRPARSDLDIAAAAAVAASPPPAAASPHWRIVDPPPGFRLAESLAEGADSTAQHLLFSDGLASVSIYIERAPVALPPGRTTHGALSVYSAERDGERVTALGNVPEATLERMVRSAERVR